jgi:WD40 repeat protein
VRLSRCDRKASRRSATNPAQPMSPVMFTMTPILLPGFEKLYSLAWLPEGKRLVTNSAGGTISMWEVATGQRLEQFQITLGGVSLTNFSSASISPVYGTPAIPAQGSVAAINLETGQVIQVMEYDVTRPETHAAITSWSGDGKKLAGRYLIWVSPISLFGMLRQARRFWPSLSKCLSIYWTWPYHRMGPSWR